MQQANLVSEVTTLMTAKNPVDAAEQELLTSTAVEALNAGNDLSSEYRLLEAAARSRMNK